MGDIIADTLKNVAAYDWTEPKITTRAEPKPGFVAKEDMADARNLALRLAGELNESTINTLGNAARRDMLTLLEKTGTYAVHHDRNSGAAATILGAAEKIASRMEQETPQEAPFTQAVRIRNNLGYALNNIRPGEVPEGSPFRDREQNLKNAEAMIARSYATIAAEEKRHPDVSEIVPDAGVRKDHIELWSFAKRIEGQIAFSRGDADAGFRLQNEGVNYLDTSDFKQLTEAARTHRRLAEESLKLSGAENAGSPGKETWLARAEGSLRQAHALWQDSGREIPENYKQMLDGTHASVQAARAAQQEQAQQPQMPAEEGGVQSGYRLPVRKSGWQHGR
jgi:hypothetical protein